MPRNDNVEELLEKAFVLLEERLNQLSDTLLASQDFMQRSQAAANFKRRMERRFAQRMARMLSLYNLPSRDDVEALADRLMDIDNRLDTIENRLSRMDPVETSVQRPARKAKARRKAAARKKSTGA